MKTQKEYKAELLDRASAIFYGLKRKAEKTKSYDEFEWMEFQTILLEFGVTI